MSINRVYSFSYFKYGIYKPREVKKKSDKETSTKHEFLHQIFFYLPRFINPIFKIGEMNKLYITCISSQQSTPFKRLLWQVKSASLFTLSFLLWVGVVINNIFRIAFVFILNDIDSRVKI